MVKLFVGAKGSGKTKRLIDSVNEALNSSSGNVVCVERDDLLRFQLNYKVRLVPASQYGIVGYDAFYGFLAGLCAGDHDISDILVDGTLKIGGSDDFEKLADFLEKVNKLGDMSGTAFTFTISTDVSNLPRRVSEYCNIL